MPSLDASSVSRPLLFLLALLCIPTAHAATILVTSNADGVATDGNCTLREAVQAANTNTAVDLCAAGDADNDTIAFATPFTITLTAGEILITDDVAITGGATRTTINAAGASRIFDVNTTGGAGSLQRVSFTALVLQNGNSSMGGSSAPDAGGAVDLKAGSAATFTDVDVTGNSCGINGGGIHGAGNTDIVITTSAAGTSLVQNNEARGAESNRGGGGVWGAGTVTISGAVTINNNRATGAAGSGGGVFNLGGTLTIGSGVVISNNTANRAGGGVEANEGTTSLSGVTLSGNNAGTAPGNGGGLHITGTGSVSITGGMATTNTAVEGGALWCSAGCTMTVDGTTIQGNTASGSDGPTQGGGGVYNDGMLTLTNATISGNQATGTAGSGGGILNVGGTLMVSGGMLMANTAVRAGGGIESNVGSVTLTDVDFTSNTAGASPGNGGALHVTGAATVTATAGEVRTNTAAREGGGFWNDSGTMTLTNTLFDGNVANGMAADDGGGGVFNNGGTLILNSVIVQNNTAVMGAGSGGGVMTLGGTLTITGGTIALNQANRAGAGIENAGGAVMLTNVMLTDNLIPVASTAPGNGGGLHAGGGSVTVNGGVISGNTANEGGGLWSNAVLTVQPSDSVPALVQNNVGRGNDATQGGGGVFAETGGDVRLFNVTMTGNRATGTSGSGGGLFVADGSTVLVEGGSISMNQANRAGAGIEVADDGATSAATALVLNSATVDGNTIATAAPGNGGGLHIGGAGVATIRKATFSNNAANEGAGIWVAGTSTLDLALSTVSGNTSVTEGGGVYDNGGASSATITLGSATIVGNTAAAGGGLFSQSADGASFMLDNTIVADNLAPTGADCSGMIRSGGYNLIENPAGCTISGMTGTNVTGQDPMLGPLADNGGPTLTHLPAMGSPAVNAGQTDYMVDQRDFLRAVGQDDIGSVERGAMPVDGEPDAPQGEAAFALSAPAPNPARGQASVRFTLAASQPARVTLHDVLGRQVAVLFEGDAPAGTAQTVRVPLDGLAPGVYLLRLESAGQADLQRLTVVR